MDTINLVRPANRSRLGPRDINNVRLHKFISRVNLKGNPNFFAKTSHHLCRVPITKFHYLLSLGFINKHIKTAASKKQQYDEEGKKTTAEGAQLVYRDYLREAYLAEARRLENWILVKTDLSKYGVTCSRPGKAKRGIIVKPGVLENDIAKAYYKKMMSLATDPETRKALDQVFPSGMAMMQLTMTCGTNTTAKRTVIVTPKLFHVARYIHQAKGKQYVYSNDVGSNEIIAAMIERMFGYKNITKEVRVLKRRYHVPVRGNGGIQLSGQTTQGRSRMSTNSGRSNTTQHPHERNFILMTDKRGKDIETFQAYMSGLDMIEEGKKRIVESGSHEKFKRNDHGQRCKIIFVSGELFTGTDINALRGVHLLNPMASHVSSVQARGRAARSRGHHFLTEANRNAKVFTYMTIVKPFGTKSPEVSIDRILECFAGDREKRQKFKAAYQWLMGRSYTNTVFRMNGVNRMNTNNNNRIIPTADSATERQEKYDYGTVQMINFEHELKTALRRQ